MRSWILGLCGAAGGAAMAAGLLGNGAPADAPKSRLPAETMRPAGTSDLTPALPAARIAQPEGLEAAPAALAPAPATDVHALLRRAANAREEGDDAGARELYQRAAAAGSAEAHFMLAYAFVVTAEQAIHHFGAAARHGHARALAGVLDDLLFQPRDWRLADPELALAIYETAKRANPELKIYGEEERVRLMRMCAEAGRFDAERFAEEHGLDGEDLNSNYGVWELAEEASAGERFGRPDAALVFQLVMRGSHVPAEFASAVGSAYAAWKAGTVEPFDIADHITSGRGCTYIAARGEREDRNRRAGRMGELKSRIDADLAPLLDRAYASATAFITAKSDGEECHGGSGRGAWMLESRREQLNAYLAIVGRVAEQFIPAPTRTATEANAALAQRYERAAQLLRTAPVSGFNTHFTLEQLQNTQRLWVDHRRESAALFAALHPASGDAVWTIWLTERRIKDLEALEETLALFGD